MWLFLEVRGKRTVWKTLCLKALMSPHSFQPALLGEERNSCLILRPTLSMSNEENKLLGRLIYRLTMSVTHWPSEWVIFLLNTYKEAIVWPADSIYKQSTHNWLCNWQYCFIQSEQKWPAVRKLTIECIPTELHVILKLTSKCTWMYSFMLQPLWSCHQMTQ